MKKYIQKSITVEAQQWFPEIDVDGVILVPGSLQHAIEDYGVIGDEEVVIRPGDWVVKSPNGRLRLCEKESFESLYEEV